MLFPGTWKLLLSLVFITSIDEELYTSVAKTIKKIAPIALFLRWKRPIRNKLTAKIVFFGARRGAFLC